MKAKRLRRTFCWKILYRSLKLIMCPLQQVIVAVIRTVVPSWHPFLRCGIASRVVSSPVDTRREVYRSSITSRPLPIPLEGRALYTGFLEEKEVRLPSSGVIIVENGFATEKAAHLTQEGYLIRELSEEFTSLSPPYIHSLLSFKPQRLHLGVTHLKGRVASLVADGHNNYYHWLFDVLPRIALLEKGYGPIDYYYVSQQHQFQRDSLQLLGISHQKIIDATQHPIIQASTLIVPEFVLFPTREGQGNFPIPPWVITFLTDRFVQHHPTSPFSRIFIDRNNAQRRRILNIDALTQLLQEHNFTTVASETLSFSEQIDIFSNASTIVAPHGAGLANIVFAPPTCTIMEIFAPRSTCTCFWSLSALKNQRYHHIYGEDNHPETHSHEDKGFDHIIINPTTLSNALSRL